ncbi:MAG: outer membrane protein assembly factor BamB [Abyssibacter sp.]|uniref:outer membrane protein assembly factor BamB n=1 Tax=Abyssibacter sp. TaxID=2320200 RepID=UPI00321B9365
MRQILLLSLFLGLTACSGNKVVNKPAELTPVSQAELRFERAWSKRVGAGADGKYAALAPLIVDTRVFAADAKGRVRAFDTGAGATLWTQDTGYRFVAGPGMGRDQILLGTLDGEVVALDAVTGEQRWRAVVDAEVLAAPVQDRGRVVARTVDGRVVGLDADTGDAEWEFNRTAPALTLRGLSNPILRSGSVIVGLDTGHVVSLDTRTGEVEWEQLIREPTGRSELERIVDVDAQLLLDDGRLFTASYGGELVVLSAITGREIWRRNLRSYTGMAIQGDQLYVTDADGKVWALDVVSGAAIWDQSELAYRGLTQPAWYRGNLVVGDYEGYLHALSPADGRIVGRTRPGRDAILTAPRVQGERLYVLASDGTLAALEATPVSR